MLYSTDTSDQGPGFNSYGR